VRVVSKGEALTILLEHTEQEGLFAMCPVSNPDIVQMAADSSRYFVLKISDGKGKHAYIGLGFNDRAEAFDFKVAVSDFHTKEQSQSKSSEYFDSLPGIDNLSLKQGEKIRVNINIKKKGKDGGDEKPSKSDEGKVSATGGGLNSFVGSLAAPTDSKKSKKKSESSAFPSSSATSSQPHHRPAAASLTSFADVFADSSPPAASASSSSKPASSVDFGFDFDSATAKPAAASAPSSAASFAATSSNKPAAAPTNWVAF